MTVRGNHRCCSAAVSRYGGRCTRPTAASGRHHGHVASLPDFGVVAVLFLAAFANWLAFLVLDVLLLVLLAILHALHVAAPVFRVLFTRLCVPLLQAASRAFPRTTTDPGILASTESGHTTLLTENYDDATQKMCVLLFSSECSDVLHDLDLQFVEMDVVTTIDMHDKLLQLDLQNASKTRTFPQVFTMEVRVDKPTANRIPHIPEWVLQKAEFFLATPVTELARLSVLDLSVHRLFTSVPKRKTPHTFAEQVLALPSGVLITHPTSSGSC